MLNVFFFNQNQPTKGYSKAPVSKGVTYYFLSCYFGSGPEARPDGLDVTVIVKEMRRITGNAHTSVGNNEGSLVRIINLHH